MSVNGFDKKLGCLRGWEATLHPQIIKILTSVIFLGAASAVLPAHASDIPPIEIGREINLATSAATAVVSDLQTKINDAKLVNSDVSPDKLKAALRDNFGKLTGNAFDSAPDPVRADIRTTVEKAFAAVTDKYRADMLKGGQDALVPAFFRAQLLDFVNQEAKGRYLAFVTMRENELINRDSNAERLVNSKAVLAYVNDLLEKGTMAPQSRTVDGKLVSYWPMTISEPCAACHKRSGLEQKIGAFGGATFVIVDAAKK